MMTIMMIPLLQPLCSVFLSGTDHHPSRHRHERELFSWETLVRETCLQNSFFFASCDNSSMHSTLKKQPCYHFMLYFKLKWMHDLNLPARFPAVCSGFFFLSVGILWWWEELPGQECAFSECKWDITLFEKESSFTRCPRSQRRWLGSRQQCLPVWHKKGSFKICWNVLLRNRSLLATLRKCFLGDKLTSYKGKLYFQRAWMQLPLVSLLFNAQARTRKNLH